MYNRKKPKFKNVDVNQSTINKVRKEMCCSLIKKYIKTKIGVKMDNFYQKK